MQRRLSLALAAVVAAFPLGSALAPVAKVAMYRAQSPLLRSKEKRCRLPSGTATGLRQARDQEFDHRFDHAPVVFDLPPLRWLETRLIAECSALDQPRKSSLAWISTEANHPNMER
jgi:hypothetical protein